MKSMEEYLTVAIEAAEAACVDILNVYNSVSHEVEIKSDDSPLTRADREAHKTILSKLIPLGLPILSEEGNDEIPYEIRSQWASYWLVDPLDGTKEFIKKNGEFTVNIALVQRNVPALGVVAVPVTGELFFAVTGGGAFVKTNGVIKNLSRRHSADRSQSGLRVVASRSHATPETEAFIEKLHEPNLISVGSSLKFMSLAKGEADIYPRFVPSMEWDIAASHVIVKETGMEIRNAYTDEVLEYNKKDLINPYFVCA